jgi:hypothetical protein
VQTFIFLIHTFVKKKSKNKSTKTILKLKIKMAVTA